jgi:hypothetical protein
MEGHHLHLASQLWTDNDGRLYPHCRGSNIASPMTFMRSFVVALLSMGVALPGRAETILITKVGAWQAFGGKTTGGRPVCGVSQSDDGKYFGLKFYAGDSTFTVQLGAKGWRLDNGAKQKLQMILDGNRPWMATGTGMHFGDGDAGLEFTINRSEIDQFAAQFRTSGALRVQFTDWDAPEWSLSLAGSNAVTDAFLQCIIGLR